MNFVVVQIVVRHSRGAGLSLASGRGVRGRSSRRPSPEPSPRPSPRPPRRPRRPPARPALVGLIFSPRGSRPRSVSARPSSLSCFTAMVLARGFRAASSARSSARSSSESGGSLRSVDSCEVLVGRAGRSSSRPPLRPPRRRRRRPPCRGSPDSDRPCSRGCCSPPSAAGRSPVTPTSRRSTSTISSVSSTNAK